MMDAEENIAKIIEKKMKQTRKLKITDYNYI
jgi:hypothetical protein